MPKTQRETGNILRMDTIQQLLEARQYRQIDQLLHWAQLALGSSDDAVRLSNILLCARQICLAHNILRETIEWHQSASEEAVRQEEILFQYLQVIMSAIDNCEQRITSGLLDISSIITEVNRVLNGGNGKLSQITPTRRDLRRRLVPQAVVIEPTKTAVEPSLIVYGLGPFRIYYNDREIKNWTNRKCKALLQYLLLHRQYPVAKEVLMELFWPGITVDAARNNLNVTIYNLRQVFRQFDESVSYICFQSNSYLLNPDLNIWTDFESFMEAARRGQRLEQKGGIAESLLEFQQAVLLYDGELFADARYDEWIEPHRRALNQQYMQLLDHLSEHAFERDNLALCIELCNKQLTVDACCENAHYRLMLCYMKQGQLYLAIRQYYQCVELLEKELEIAPSVETTQLFEQIRIRV